MGVEIPQMAADIDAPLSHSTVCIGMACSRTLKKLDQPSPWDWIGHIRFGYLPILRGLVGSSQGEEEEKIV